ncbi:hypothetical protein D499_0V00630 [Hanseniaspora uvarum DSM 2768]|nr:hypothetical protein D499_0V00630 [Hanseniaspora uvarum DSM 2768]
MTLKQQEIASSSKSNSNFTHFLIQTCLQRRSGCSEQKFDQMIKKISLILWKICIDELKGVDTQSKQVFFSKCFFVVYNTDANESIDKVMLQIKERHLDSSLKLNEKFFIYIDKPKDILMFLVIDFDKVYTGKVNLEKSKGFNLSKVSTNVIKNYSFAIQNDIKSYCKLYLKAIAK